ncbi:hypothetical protein DFQ11_106166 [Winogradskyella epiphytica]|uniref:Sugar-phosphatase n=1 Tax=Winogradskyella epiphytica TaxID=262005 RepID=A0A2V4XXJ3_9FLAO|nr:HAD family hydrolase [Winogradskyella epiphytica]PYE80363.1 hypothetical protein DFQ11_106166 [Winogradskyella epiphytica]GGW70789.1 haloacid dehalogenase [Winogradskyella epiphytica]
MKDIKLVVADMDGTLLNSKHEVSPRFFDVFKQLKQQNILFVAASGRPYYSISEKLKPLLNDIIIVAENGGLVIEQEQVLISNVIASEHIAELYRLVTSIDNTYPIFCTKHCAYINNASDDLVQTFSEYYSNYILIDSIDEIKDPVVKIALYHPTNSEANIFPLVKHLRPALNVVVSGNHWVDISDAKTNKGNALAYLQNRLKIKPSETMVFGDYNNDLDMLKLATYSYAMENAHPDVKATANFSTSSNDAYGVEVILERLIAESRKY